MKYNTVLRAGSGVPYLVLAFQRMCKSNTYTTTMHVINSSIVKLGKITVACKVYRGISKGILPDDFWRRNVLNVRGSGPVSSSTSPAPPPPLLANRPPHALSLSPLLTTTPSPWVACA